MNKHWIGLGLITALTAPLLAFSLLGGTPNWPARLGAPLRTENPGPLPLQQRQEPSPQLAPEILDNDIRFERITQEQGLSVSVVYQVAQDPRGFLWFATEDGLFRYDGRQFVVFKHDPQNTNSLGHNWINSLVIDPAGVLWLGTPGAGLDRFDPASGSFTHYRSDPANPAAIITNRITSLLLDRQGRLWVGTEKGLEVMDRTAGTFTHQSQSPDAPEVLNAPITSLLEDSLDRIWIGTVKGLALFDPASGQYQVYQRESENSRSLSFNYISDVIEDHAGQIWVATRSGLNLLDPLNGTFERIMNDPNDPTSLSSDILMGLYEDSSGAIWVSTWGGGLNRFDPTSRRFMHFMNEPANPNSLSSDYVHSVFEDASGSLWVVTWGAGVNRFDRPTEQFLHYRSRPDSDKGLSHPLVWAIVSDGDILWVGTQGGLDRLNRVTLDVQHFRHIKDDPASLPNSTVQALLLDRGGTLWVGTSGGGLARYDGEGRFTTFAWKSDDPDSLSSNNVSCIAEDSTGQIWVATYNGLNRLDRRTGKFVRFMNDVQDEQSLNSNTIHALNVDRVGQVWIGTDQGLNRLDPRTGKVTRLPLQLENEGALLDQRVMSIMEDRHGAFWLGTLGNGVLRYDLASRSFTAFREREGLPNDTVYGVLEDDQGRLWMSTNKGLARYDAGSQTFKKFDGKDGLQSNEFNSNAFYKARDGELFFGGVNGVTAFYPENIVDNPYVPPIVLVSLTQTGQDGKTTALGPNAASVKLDWPDTSFEFTFAALSYIRSDKNRYAYKLDGFDKDWVQAGSNPFGRYTNLPGGSYVLRLKGSNNDGVWNESGASLSITIIPPFWQTWWFRGSLLLVLGLVALGGYRIRVHSVETRNRQLERVVEERTREIERRHQELSALYRADEALYRNLHVDQVLQALVDSALEMLDADKGSLLVWDSEHKRLTPRVARGFHPETTARMSFAAGQGLVGIVAASGQPALVEDTAADPRITHSLTDPEGIRSILQAPICVDGEVFGVFSADFTQPRKFTDDDVRRLDALAQRAALAIQNAQLYEHTQEQAVVEERNRLARDLHDAVTQTLFSASLLAEALPAAWEKNPDEGRHLLNELRQLSRGALAEMRTLLMELRPSALAEADLGDLLRQLGEAASGREGIPVAVQLEGIGSMPPDVHIAMYRIAQEALNNALKHARASQITLVLRRTDASNNGSQEPHHCVALTVRDNGRGFDPERVVGDHFGLGIMRERAQAIGATLTIESTPGMGTQISVLWEE